MLNILEQYEIEEVKQEHEGFKVTNLESVNWCFRKIKAYNSKKADLEALAQAEIERITNWLKKETDQIDNSISFFEGKLMEYAIEQREVDPKFKVSTPYGKIGFKKQQPEWNFDEEKTIQYLETNYPEQVQIVKKFNKSELKKLVKETGEIWDGLEIVEREEKLEVKVVE